MKPKEFAAPQQIRCQGTVEKERAFAWHRAHELGSTVELDVRDRNGQRLLHGPALIPLLEVGDEDASGLLVHVNVVAVVEAPAEKDPAQVTLIGDLIEEARAEKWVGRGGNKRKPSTRPSNEALAARNRGVLDMIGEGATVMEVANRYDITDQHVRKILRQERKRIDAG